MRSGIMTKKKKKKNYIDFEADAGQGFENFDKPPTRINVFDRARKIKTWNMFIHLVEQENITPAEALTVILKHVKKSWNKYKISRDPDQRGAILTLLELQSKIGNRKLYDHKYLNDFCAWTGYKKKSFSRFQDDLSMFKAKFGGKRKKKKVPHFIDKEFKI